MKMEIRNNNAKKLWREALEYINTRGESFKDNDGRTCREVINLVLCIEDVSNSKIDEPIKIISDTKKLIYPSKEELSSIMFKKYQAPIYEYTYGGRIFGFAGVKDQINDFIIPLLRKDQNTRRAIMVLYNPAQDSDISNKNTPGIIYIQFRLKNKKLDMTSTIRSNDLLFGWPANIYQLYNLQQMVAEELKIETGDLVTISNSAHFFEEDEEHLERAMGVSDE